MFTFKHFSLLNFHCLTYSVLFYALFRKFDNNAISALYPGGSLKKSSFLIKTLPKALRTHVLTALTNQYNMQYIPCNSALIAQEPLLMTQKSTFFAQRFPKLLHNSVH